MCNIICIIGLQALFNSSCYQNTTGEYRLDFDFTLHSEENYAFLPKIKFKRFDGSYEEIDRKKMFRTPRSFLDLKLLDGQTLNLSLVPMKPCDIETRAALKRFGEHDNWGLGSPQYSVSVALLSLIIGTAAFLIMICISTVFYMKDGSSSQ